MMRQAGAGLLTFVGAWLLVLTGLYPMAVLLVAALMAFACAQGRFLGAAILGGAFTLAITLGGGALPGLLAGLCCAGGAAGALPFRRHWSWTAALALASVAVAAPTAVNAAVNAEELKAVALASADMLYEQFETLETEGADFAAQKKQLNWMLQHWDALVWGQLGFGVVMVSAAGLALLGALLRARGGPELAGPFRTLRLPDALVWGAIVLMGLWLYDYHYPQPWLRPYVWNTAIALSAVYWLAGLAVVTHALWRWRANPFVVFAVLLALFLPSLQPFVMLLGFFDTWGDFRLRLDRLLDGRAMRTPSDDQD